MSVWTQSGQAIEMREMAKGIFGAVQRYLSVNVSYFVNRTEVYASVLDTLGF